MTVDPWAWALFFVVDCFALYAALGVLSWRLSAGSGISLLIRDNLLLLSIGGLAGQAVATCYLLQINGWF